MGSSAAPRASGALSACDAGGRMADGGTKALLGAPRSVADAALGGASVTGWVIEASRAGTPPPPFPLDRSPAARAKASSRVSPSRKRGASPTSSRWRRRRATSRGSNRDTVTGSRPVAPPPGPGPPPPLRPWTGGAGPRRRPVVQDRDPVCVHLEARARLGGVVGHQQVEALGLQFPPGVLKDVVGFKGEAHRHASIPAKRHRLPGDVRVGGEGQRHLSARLPTLHLPVEGLFGAEVGNGGGEDGDVDRTHHPGHGVEHLPGRLYRRRLHPLGGFQGGGSVDQDHPGPPAPRRLGQRKTHPSRRPVPEETDRVHRLTGWAGGDEDRAPLIRGVATQGPPHVLHHLPRFQHPTRSLPLPHRQEPFGGPGHAVPQGIP